jgi:phosphoribosylglycinamide formyltransferase-1
LNPQTPIAIFASGAGSNAARLIEHFNAGPGHPSIRVAMVICNKNGAGVIQVAEKAGLPLLMIERERFYRGDAYLEELKSKNIRLLVLAGFLWKVPDALIEAYPRAIINIHPALLPNYGGKGMYGAHVHEAVLSAGEKESGITIHYVDGHYDNGDIIFQAKCSISDDETASSLAQKIHVLEHRHYPVVVENIAISLEESK